MNILKFNHNTPYVCFKTAKTSDRTKENFPNTAIHFPNSKNTTIPLIFLGTRSGKYEQQNFSSS